MTHPHSVSVFVVVLFSFTLLQGCSNNPQVVETAPTEVVVSKPVIREIQDWDEYTGLISDTGIINVVGRVRGVLVEDLKTISEDGKNLEGTEVKKGRLLFKIEPDLYEAKLKQAESNLEKWKVRKENAEADIKRLEPLIKKGSAAKKEYDDTKFAKAEAVAEIKLAEGQVKEAELNLSYCTIEAEIDGRLSKSFIVKGNLVDPATGNNQLTTIIPLDPIYMEFHINERAYLKYVDKFRKAGEAPKDVNIEVELSLAIDEGFPHKGVIDFVDTEVDPGTGSKKVRAKFPNPANAAGVRAISPGLFGKVRIPVSGKYKAIMVSERAVLTDQNRKYVLTVDKEDKNKVTRVDVALGRTTPDGLRVITSGLTEDDWVIVLGVQRVRPGVICNPTEGEMPKIVKSTP